MGQHFCPKCGTRHTAAKPARVLWGLMFVVIFGTVQFVAAMSLTGWLSVAMFVIFGFQVMTLTLSIWGLSLLASEALTEREERR